MKALLANKLFLAATVAVVVVGVGASIYFGVANKDNTETNGGSQAETSTASGDDFQRTGEKSFGLDVCNEMTGNEVASVIGKPILRTGDYSNSGSTGCEYFVTETGFVIVDVGYSDMAKQKTGLEFLERIIKTDDRIKLENMLAYSEKGLIDIYMNVLAGKKFVRVGRSSTSVVDEETLIKLAMATETKIRSFK